MRGVCGWVSAACNRRLPAAPPVHHLFPSLAPLQVNFVRTRLMGQLANLDMAVPDIAKLARELQSWCDREAAQRAVRPKA